MVTSTLLAPGETIDIYTIVEAMTPLGHIERYLATAKGDAPARVVLACAARSSRTPSEAEIYRVLDALGALREETGAARFLGGGIRYEDDIAWLAHEHIEGGASLADFAAGNYSCGGVLAEFEGGLHAVSPGGRYFATTALVRLLIDTLVAFDALGVSHGSMDPSNAIYMLESGEPILLGLGYAQVFGARAEGVLPRSTFWAPEPLPRDKPHAQADIYSLAAITYWMLTANLPSSDPSGARWSVPGAEDSFLELCIQHALERDPTRRYASWSTFKMHWDSVYNAMMGRAGAAGPGRSASHVGAGETAGTPQSGMRALPAPNTLPPSDRSAPEPPTAPLASPSPPAPPLERTLAAPTPRVLVPLAQEKEKKTPQKPDVRSGTIEATSPSGNAAVDVECSAPVDAARPAPLSPRSASRASTSIQRRSRRLQWAGLALSLVSLTLAGFTLLSNRAAALHAVGMARPSLVFVEVAHPPAMGGEIPAAHLGDIAPAKARAQVGPGRAIDRSRAPSPAASSSSPTWESSCGEWARCRRGSPRETEAEPLVRFL